MKKLKCVILAAGRGTRLKPITDKIPKPLIEIHNKTILEYILDGLIQAGICDFCLVVGYKAEKIKNWVEKTYLKKKKSKHVKKNLSIEFIFQEKINGTGAALLLTKKWTRNSPCLVTYGDILLSWSVYKRLINRFLNYEKSWHIVGNLTKDPSSGAAIYYDGNRVKKLIEKPPKTAPPTDLNNSGCYVFPSKIFSFLEETPLSSRDEIELTYPIIKYLENNNTISLCKLKDEEFWSDVGTNKTLNILQNTANLQKKIQKYI